MFLTRSQAIAALPEVYDAIAVDFAHTRHKAWGELEILFESTPQGSRILDLGCGNGRLIELFRGKNCHVTGIDLSEQLLAIAQQNFPEVELQKADMRELPFAAEFFDEVWAIASLHHLGKRRDQQNSFREIGRVLVPDGQFVMTYWNVWHLPEYASEKHKAFWRSFFFPFWWRKQDFLVPWNRLKMPRYYYAFQREEVENLARQAGFSLLECWGAARGQKVPFSQAKNICFRFQKKSS